MQRPSIPRMISISAFLTSSKGRYVSTNIAYYVVILYVLLCVTATEVPGVGLSCLKQIPLLYPHFLICLSLFVGFVDALSLYCYWYACVLETILN